MICNKSRSFVLFEEIILKLVLYDTYILGYFLFEIAYNIFMVNRFIFILSLVVLAIILVFLFFTSPTNIGPLGILFFFVMVYFLSFGVITFFMTFFVRIFFSRKEMIKKDYICAGIVAILPITVLVLIASGVRNLVILVAGPVFLVGLNVFLFGKISET